MSQLIKIELNAEIYRNPVEVFELLSISPTKRICIIVHSMSVLHDIHQDLQDYLNYHGISHKVYLHDNRFETVFGEIWIVTQDTCVEKTEGYYGVEFFITEIALENLQIGAVKRLNSRTLSWLYKKNDIQLMKSQLDKTSFEINNVLGSLPG